MKLHQFVICVKNEGYEASLEIRRVYDLLEDKGAEDRGLVRVIDESGEDYLYPKEFFVPIELPSPLRSRTANPA
jgi:hypothetical protein